MRSWLAVRRCVYRRTAAFGCGIAAALLALTGLALATAASGCFGRYGGASAPAGRRHSTAAKLSAIAWVLVAVAAAMFLYGAWRNAGGTRGLLASRHGRRRYGCVYYYGCTVLRGGVFATASVVSAIATACAIATYVFLQQTSTDEPAAPGEFAGSGVAMGQPQWSQPHQPAYPPVAYPPPPPYGYRGGGYGAKQPAGTA